MSAVPLFGETELERHARILEEARASELRAVREVLPIIRICHLTDRMVSITDEARRLVSKGYKVTLHITASETWMEVRGGPWS